MTSNAVRWDAPPLSTDCVEAVTHYRDGIAALVSGVGTAERLLGAAIGLDPSFVLARVGLAVCQVATGAPYRAPAIPVGGVRRGERQHAEVIQATLCSDRRRGDVLRREHLLEYPGDLLIVWLPVLRRGA